MLGRRKREGHLGLERGLDMLHIVVKSRDGHDGGEGGNGTGIGRIGRDRRILVEEGGREEGD